MSNVCTLQAKSLLLGASVSYNSFYDKGVLFKHYDREEQLYEGEKNG